MEFDYNAKYIEELNHITDATERVKLGNLLSSILERVAKVGDSFNEKERELQEKINSLETELTAVSKKTATPRAARTSAKTSK